MPEAECIRLRIGVNLGDVIVDGTDIYGDGVNVAARLEQLAEPGGIVVSGTVFDHLRGGFGWTFASLGEQHLKNFERPASADGGASTKVAAGSARPQLRGRWRYVLPNSSVPIVPVAPLGAWLSAREKV